MRKYIFPLALIAGFIFAAAAGAGEEMMSIQVKSGSLRETPSFLGKIVTAVNYGDRAEIVAFLKAGQVAPGGAK
ncbi:MAG: hypothetical protein NTV79_04570 [Candidatus Aureabacteria bacterium]|nr:hypothetical protein [Candidatus Auribacterota bacterium]